MDEEKNVATVTKPEQVDCLELVKKLADSYRCLIRRRELLRQQYEESKSWFTRRKRSFTSCRRVHMEESERVQTERLVEPSGTHGP